MRSEHIHAVCKLDGPLDSDVTVLSSFMAARLNMEPVLVNLVAAQGEGRTASAPRQLLEELVEEAGVQAISFAFSIDGVLSKPDFEHLAHLRAKSVRMPLLAVAYTTDLWAQTAIDVLESAIPLGDPYVKSFVAILPPTTDATKSRLASKQFPLRLIAPTAGVRVSSFDDFSRFAKLIQGWPTEAKPGDHVAESVISRLTMEGGHGLGRRAWDGIVLHMLSCTTCGAKARYYTLNANFFAGAASR